MLRNSVVRAASATLASSGFSGADVAAAAAEPMQQLSNAPASNAVAVHRDHLVMSNPRLGRASRAAIPNPTQISQPPG
jgi:hypothetical protein